MSDLFLLDDYRRMTETTWAVLSSLLTVGMYFKFRRFWSLRNLDLLALIALAPGLLLVSPNHQHPGNEHLGYIWLFSVSGFFLVRTLLDSVMVRRPLLEPNLSADGLTFTGAAMLAFLMTNVILTPNIALQQNDTAGHAAGYFLHARVSSAPVVDAGGKMIGILAEKEVSKAIAAPEGAARLVGDLLPRKRDGARAGASQASPAIPGHPLFLAFTTPPAPMAQAEEAAHPEARRQHVMQEAVSESVAILAHFAVVIGMVLIGYRHFDSAATGIAAASLYLLLPYTGQMSARPEHVVPAALLVWAVEAYRRPLVAGILLGLAAAAYYPLYLLPLWCGFYWRRGMVRFGLGVTAALLLLVALLPITAHNTHDVLAQLTQMFWVPLVMTNDQFIGFWHFHTPAYRIPVYAAFVALCGSLALWPPQKNLGTLLSCSAMVMLGVQFWRAHYGGLMMAWFLPLLILTIFRPNLEDRVALTAVREIWRRKVVASG